MFVLFFCFSNGFYNLKRSKIFLWVSKSISRLRVTHWGDFGWYTKRYGVDFETGKYTFRWSKKMNFFRIFEIPKFSLDFTVLHGYHFWALQWFLGIQKLCFWHLKVSSDFARYFGVNLGGIKSVVRWISRQENAIFDCQKMNYVIKSNVIEEKFENFEKIHYFDNRKVHFPASKSTS